MPTYGQRPDDVVQDSRGNALSGVAIRLYGSQTSAEAGGTPLATAVTDSRGRWVYEAAAGELWARLPDTTVWQITDPNNLEDYLNITEGDARYYTQAQVDSAIAVETDARVAADADKSDVGHTHDDRYYTEAEVDSLIAGVGGGGGGGPVTSADITDATTVGKAVLTAADAAAARTAIGAGTSSLALGTTSSTAKAGDYQPAAANISDSTSVGRSVLTAADAAAARTAIGAGTGDVTGTSITAIWGGTQAAYDALGSWSSTTLYVITG